MTLMPRPRLFDASLLICQIVTFKSIPIFYMVLKYMQTPKNSYLDKLINLITNFLEYFKINPSQYHYVNFINLVTHYQFLIFTSTRSFFLFISLYIIPSYYSWCLFAVILFTFNEEIHSYNTIVL